MIVAWTPNEEVLASAALVASKVTIQARMIETSELCRP
jgi:hypothetical protein